MFRLKKAGVGEWVREGDEVGELDGMASLGMEARSMKDGRSAGAPRGEAQALPGAGEGSPSGLSYQLQALLPHGSAGSICTATPSTFHLHSLSAPAYPGYCRDQSEAGSATCLGIAGRHVLLGTWQWHFCCLGAVLPFFLPPALVEAAWAASPLILQRCS